jgi:hypothetical protein
MSHREINNAQNVGTPYWRASLGSFASICIAVGAGFGFKDWPVGLATFGVLLYVLSLAVPRN